jgi:dihydroxyacetone kinase-like protein
MMPVTSDDLRRMFGEIAAAITAEKDELCRLDGVIGDADHGVAMALGFDAARDAVDALAPGAEPTAVMNAAAKAFLSAVGASTGPLYATALMRAGAAVKGKPALDDADVAAMVQAMAGGIADRGKAELGEKTMLDAWAPAAEAIAAAAGPLGARLAAAEAAARTGAEATKGMVAGKGRSVRLGERALGHVDPGAASAVIVLAAMGRALG